jgi:hypothetical protein
VDIDVKRQKDGSYVATVKGDRRKPRLEVRGRTFQEAAMSLLQVLAVAPGSARPDNRVDVKPMEPTEVAVPQEDLPDRRRGA